MVNAEEKHRPKGYENDPRSAVYVITSKERVSVDFNRQQFFSKLSVHVCACLAFYESAAMFI